MILTHDWVTDRASRQNNKKFSLQKVWITDLKSLLKQTHTEHSNNNCRSTFKTLTTYWAITNISTYFKGLLLLLLSRFSHVRLCVTSQTAAHQAPHPWDSPGKNTEWVAISFSNAWKWKVKVKSLSRVRLLATPWTTAYQAPPLSILFFIFSSINRVLRTPF